MKGISIIGSTGSIGTQALEVIAVHADRLHVVGLAAGSQLDVLARQIQRYQPKIVAVPTPDAAIGLQRLLAQGPKISQPPEIMYGAEGLEAVAVHPQTHMVLTSVVGALGLKPTLAAIEAGKDIALANKETLVAAGELVMTAVQRRGVRLIPVDSEHSALFQSLVGEDSRTVRRLILTASGGPFRGRTDLSGVTREEALKHPRWVMGAKITVDSATLMNKALEMIEAHWLFSMPIEAVEVLIHPQSIIHSAVEFIDGNIMAQLGLTDMRLPIQYALTYPERVQGFLAPLNLIQIGTLTFESPDPTTFPSLNYARDAVTMGGTMPTVMNAANEVAVQRFLRNEIPFLSIFKIVHDVMERHHTSGVVDLPTILEADAWARQVATSMDRW